MKLFKRLLKISAYTVLILGTIYYLAILTALLLDFIGITSEFNGTPKIGLDIKQNYDSVFIELPVLLVVFVVYLIVRSLIKTKQ
jgi:hypothetical protein